MKLSKALIIASILCGGFIAPAYSASVGHDKKLIQWGWGTPSIEHLAIHGPELDKDTPFDGLITAGTYTSNGKEKSFAWSWFGKEKIPREAADKWIAGLKAAGFKRMKHIFILMVTMPGTVDWFDDFTAINRNARLIARVAKQGGCVGIMLDFEEYGRKRGIAPFTYSYQKYHDTKTYKEYAAQVKLRGKQLGQALSSEFPDAVLLMTGAHAGVYDRMRFTRPLDDTVYGLLPPLVDGLMEGTPPSTTIVDACEGAYGYREMNEFRQAREMIWKGATVSSNPKLYAERMHVGFGLRMDYEHGGKKWDTEDFNNNYFTPDEFEYAAFCAQRVSDKYVWIYTQQLNFWTNENLPPEYLQALINSREDHFLHRGKRRSMMNETITEMEISSKTTPGSDDQSTFGELWDEYEEIASLPLVWKFSLDPEDIGIEEGWFAIGLDESSWKDIEIKEWWEPQGYRYDGIAWYRTPLEMPSGYEGRRIWLAFGAVDNSAFVYLNGKKVGERDRIGKGEWTQPFLMEITDHVQHGKPNQLTVRVLDRHLLGGIWKSVKVITERTPD